MAIPTQFSVTKKAKRPIANPDNAQDLANVIRAESIGFISGASALPSKASGGTDSAVVIGSETVPAQDDASLIGALSVGSISNPSLIGSESAPVQDDASALPVVAQPSISNASAASTQSAPSISTPSTITPNAGTDITPSFPLNHARILSSNKLEGYSSVSSDVGGVALNALKRNTWEKWRPTAAGYFKVVLNSAQTVDTVCIGAHNMGSRGFTISPQYRETDGGPLLQFAGARTPSKDSAIMFHRSSAVNVKVLEIYVSNGTNGEIGYISAGLALQMQRPMFNGHQPYTDSDVTEYYSNRTESGEIIGKQIRRKGYETTYEWNNISDEWYRVYFAPFKEAIKTKPFFVAWNLLEYPDDVAFGETSGDISTSMQNGTMIKRSSLSFTLKGV
jgi:hypothetical protein